LLDFFFRSNDEFNDGFWVNEGRQMTEKKECRKEKRRFFNTQGEKSDNGQNSMIIAAKEKEKRLILHV